MSKDDGCGMPSRSGDNQGTAGCHCEEDDGSFLSAEKGGEKRGLEAEEGG